MKIARIFVITILILSVFSSYAFVQDWFEVTKENINDLEYNNKSNYESAYNILEDDFMAPDDIMETWHVSYTKEQLDYFANSAPSEDVLYFAKENGYVVVAGPPLSMNLLDIVRLKPELFWSNGKGWYMSGDLNSFVREDKVEAKWLIIRKELVSGSVDRNWKNQLQLLKKNEYVPNIAELCWFIITFYEVKGTRLFEQIFVRTSSSTINGYIVDVGYFDEDGMRINYCLDDCRYSFLGITAFQLKKINGK